MNSKRPTLFATIGIVLAILNVSTSEPINSQAKCLRNEKNLPKPKDELPPNFAKQHPRSLLLDMLECPTFIVNSCTQITIHGRMQIVGWRSTMVIRSTAEDFIGYGISKNDAIKTSAELAVSKLYDITKPRKNLYFDNCKASLIEMGPTKAKVHAGGDETEQTKDVPPEVEIPGQVQSVVQNPELNQPTGSQGQVPEEATSADADDVYPPAPIAGGCRILINEVTTQNDYNGISFIEHRKVCPLNSKNKSVMLSGFVEIILKSGTTIQQTFFADLNRQKLIGVSEKKEGTNRQVRNLFFLIGTEESSPNLKFTEAQAIAELKDGLTNLDTQVVCIILLHLGENWKDYDELKLDRDGNSFLPTPLNDHKMNIISQYVQDLVIIGPPCHESECGFFFSLLRSKESVIGEGGILIPIPEKPKNDEEKKTYSSLSLCSQSLLPMQVDYFQDSTPTPNKMNLCSVKKLPFDFKGIALQSTAQKLIINVKTFFEVQKQLNSAELIGSPVEKTAEVTGVNTKKVYQVEGNYKTNTIKTPGKKRNKPTPVASQFDVMRCELVTTTILSFYANNKAPTFDLVYNKFMDDTREEERGRQERGEILIPFKCSKWSLRKMLRKLGYKYGTINKRAVVLMRNDVVARRIEYLKAMKHNRESSIPKCVIYTDETWIDPHARTGKSWVPRQPKSYREEALYSFRNPKTSRGARVIVLHAGGADGFVSGAMKIYTVSKKKVAEDYHSNVDGNAYMEWWRNLNQKVKEQYGSCFIVIDNAPYHSTSEAPKSGDKKKVFYDWLAINLEEPARSQLKQITDYRRPELWNMVMKMKNSNKYYLVDKEAEKYGNTVIRLPPYNCDLNPIEYVWKDIKHAVKSSNTEATATFAVQKATEIMNGYTKDQWKKHVEHVIRLEQKYWKDDGVYESFLDNFEDQIQPALPEWARQGVVITLEDMNEEDDQEDWDDSAPIYDPFRADVHGDVGEENYPALFENVDIEVAEEQPDPASRRRLQFDDDTVNE